MNTNRTPFHAFVAHPCREFRFLIAEMCRTCGGRARTQGTRLAQEDLSELGPLELLVIDDSLRDFSVEELRQTRPDLLLIVLFYQEEDRRALISQRVDMPLRMLPFQTSLVLEWFKGL